MIQGQLLGDRWPPALVPVIIFGGFCNWSVSGEVLGFWGETLHFFFTKSSRVDLYI